MNHKAIYTLYPTVVTVDDTAGAFDAQGNKVTIDLAAVNAWVDPESYKLQRKYPLIGDQLDMLWHAIDNGTLNKTSDFYTAIKAVKDEHPKE
jgi:hypothetical protein